MQSTIPRSFSAASPKTCGRPVCARSAASRAWMRSIDGHVLAVAVAERVRPEDHRQPAVEQGLDDPFADRKRGQSTVSFTWPRQVGA